MRFWKKNLWKTPGGKVGKAIIQEQTFLLDSWTRTTNLELIALTLHMIFLPLILQKSGTHVKAPAVKAIVDQRLQKWHAGNIDDLLKEATYLQEHAQNGGLQQKTNPAKIFSRLMLQGKVKAALRVVSGTQGGVASPSETVLKKLKEKHPDAAPTDPSFIIQEEFKQVPSSSWEKIDANMIRTIALNTKGAAGWSGVDSDDIRPLLCSKNYGVTSENYCEAVAGVTKRLCREFVDPSSLTTFLACRLIPLEKGDNDVRPIGIGETLRRIVGKAVTRSIRQDIQTACGCVQVCAGIEAGCEAAIHAVREIY